MPVPQRHKAMFGDTLGKWWCQAEPDIQLKGKDVCQFHNHHAHSSRSTRADDDPQDRQKLRCSREQANQIGQPYHFWSPRTRIQQWEISCIESLQTWQTHQLKTTSLLWCSGSPERQLRMLQVQNNASRIDMVAVTALHCHQQQSQGIQLCFFSANANTTR